MEVNLLGSLEVLRNDIVITPSAPKLRQVLSLLTVNANRVVRRERLVDELWDDNPPTSVTTTVQTYIYQLRKQLGLGTAPHASSAEADSAAATLHTTPKGYQLSLDPAGLDSTRFELLADRGHVEFEAGRFASAATTLADALSLWRGPALVDVPLGPSLRSETLRLEEMRKKVLEQRLEADLQLGRHQELIGELTGLTAEQPTNERYPEMLMLALHRSGRRADALDVYQQTRAVLSDRLGLDPSSYLQRIHHAVLAADPGLDLPSLRTRTSIRSGPPEQLPPERGALVGRESQLTKVLDAMVARRGSGPTVVALIGPPGSGTSALCIRAGHELRDRYPDGQLCARLSDLDGGQVPTADLLAEFLRSMGMPESQMPASADERSRVFLNWSAQRRMLLVLDDVFNVEQLLPLLPFGAGCGVLLNSRRRMFTPSVATTVEVPPLDHADGVRLLTDLLGEHRVAEDRAGTDALVALCDGLPMALHAVVTRLQERPHWPISRLVSWIGVEADHRRSADDPLGMRSSVDRTWRSAPPAVRDAFRRLAAAESATMSVAEAARVLAVDEHHAESLVERLVEFQLMQAESVAHGVDARYRFVPCVRTVGRQLGPDSSAPAQRRNADDGNDPLRPNPRGERRPRDAAAPLVVTDSYR
ncbi:BTAD domain-containing putative transcriptional regulator [Actinosynnema sp. CS-041913]|uniref:AfsR/SARP family transcriptional regulator n=1 Tax=Actinosynnema sp. CS-041913 TaxID=3239917 RepID=UPI003D9249B7